MSKQTIKLAKIKQQHYVNNKKTKLKVWLIKYCNNAVERD